MTSTPSSAAPGNRLFVLALSLLVGFVIAFVMLLARLPVDGATGGYASGDIKTDLGGSTGYQFYTVLEDQTVAQEEEAKAPVIVRENNTITRATITPATRVVPGNVQSLSSRSLASESYAEIPASSLGQESYFLQAGNFRKAEEAEQARAALLLLGLDAFVVVRQDNDGAVGHRVRIGPFFDQNKVSQAKQRLQDGGINYKLIRVTG